MLKLIHQNDDLWGQQYDQNCLDKREIHKLKHQAQLNDNFPEETFFFNPVVKIFPKGNISILYFGHHSYSFKTEKT